MSTLMQRCLTMLARMAPAVAGGTIVYSRGADSVAIKATYGRSEFTSERDGVVTVDANDRDFMFEIDDLILGGVTTLPVRGDRITDAEGRLFEVSALGGAQVYQACDAEGTRVRVHTKRIAV
jgi:hypothetical protein